MTCPTCHENSDKVADSDESFDGAEVIRRRLCHHCDARWLTREIYAARLSSPVPQTARSVGAKRGAKPRRPISRQHN